MYITILHLTGRKWTPGKYEHPQLGLRCSRRDWQGLLVCPTLHRSGEEAVVLLETQTALLSSAATPLRDAYLVLHLHR